MKQEDEDRELQALQLWNLIASRPTHSLPLADALRELEIDRAQLETLIGSLCALSDSATGARINLSVTNDAIALTGSAGSLSVEPLSAGARDLLQHLSPSTSRGVPGSVGTDAYFGPFFHPLAEAIQDGVRCTISYRAARDDSPRTRTVDPHALVHERGAAYLVAWDVEKDAQRRYRMDRIAAFAATEASVEPHAFTDVTLDESLASTGARAVVGMPTWFYFDQLRWVGARPLAPANEGEGEDDLCRVEVFYESEAWLFDQILSSAGEMEILEPETLVEDFRAFAAGLLASCPA